LRKDASTEALPLFRNLFDFRGFKLYDLHEDEQGITLVLHCTRKTGDCPECGTRCSSIEDTYTRRIRDLDLGPKQCFLIFTERSGRYGVNVAIVALRS
jgi:transposase